MKRYAMLATASIALAAAGLIAQVPATGPFDLVVANGRVIDPESNTDAVRFIGVSGSSIRAVSQAPLQGRSTIDARGLVVSPGFIDLHQHGQTPENDRLKVQDGVTTALELEIGVPDVGSFLKERAGPICIAANTARLRIALLRTFEDGSPTAATRSSTTRCLYCV